MITLRIKEHIKIEGIGDILLVSIQENCLEDKDLLFLKGKTINYCWSVVDIHTHRTLTGDLKDDVALIVKRIS